MFVCGRGRICLAGRIMGVVARRRASRGVKGRRDSQDRSSK